MKTPYPASDDYIQFVFELLDEFDNTQTDSPISPGHPKTDSNYYSGTILKH